MYKVNKYKYNLQQYDIRPFGRSIYTGKINIEEAGVDQSNLLEKED